MSGSLRPRTPRCRGRTATVRGRGHARRREPEVTDKGSPARPILVAASWLADQATVAVATIPSNAAAIHNTVWRFTITASYSGRG